MLFTFDESALLGELETRPTLQDLAQKLGKDASVISRDLKRISEKAAVIEKINGRWALTSLGLEIACWSKKIQMEQSEILGKEYTLTVATTREFASKILAKNFDPFLQGQVRFKIITCENGIEEALLKGVADFGFDCGKPNDPGIAFKQIIEESIVTVGSTAFVKTKKIKNVNDLNERDFIFYSRLNPSQVKNIDVRNALITSNDIAVVRNLIRQNYGWATLPYYAVREEIQKKELAIIPGGDIKGYKFGVWWLRGRESLLPKVKMAESWLSQQKLEF